MAADRTTMDIVDLAGPATTAEVLVEQRMRRAGSPRRSSSASSWRMDLAVADYTFLPWSRRGLAGRTPPVALDQPLPAQVSVDVGVTLTAIPESRFSLTVNGPGDVMGLDPRVVVRTDPRPHSVDVEPNYLPARRVRPARPALDVHAGGERSGRSAAAVVRARRRRPRGRRSTADRTGAAATGSRGARPLVDTELPDLAESWAWAHTQVVAPDGEDPAAALAARPAMNVSRILAPRRLQPGRRYAACLVPAFDAGVVRGLGGEPDASRSLSPAWPVLGGGDVRLPVYYWWPFATGSVVGDFEQLASRLRPFAVPVEGGGEPMYVGAAGPELPAKDAGDPAAYLVMDGALRAWQGSSARLDEVPVTSHRARQHARRHRRPGDVGSVGDHSRPRTAALRRVAGAPAHRAGRRAALAERAQPRPEVQGRGRARGRAGPPEPGGLRPVVLGAGAGGPRREPAAQPDPAVPRGAAPPAHPALRAPAGGPAAQLTAPLHSLDPAGSVTITASIAGASLPDAAADPALRRLTSPQRPVLRTAMARATRADRPRSRRASVWWPGSPPPATAST